MIHVTLKECPACEGKGTKGKGKAKKACPECINGGYLILEVRDLAQLGAAIKLFKGVGDGARDPE